MGLLHQSNNYKITLASTHNAIVGYIVITLHFPDATEILRHSRAVHMYVFIIHAELSIRCYNCSFSMNYPVSTYFLTITMVINQYVFATSSPNEVRR